MTRKLDIAICGCGPAGLAAALLLHRTGNRVQIFERFATPQPVGSGLILQPTGLAVLSELGLIADTSRLGNRIDRLFGRVVPSNRVVLDVRYRALGAGWHAIAIHRSVLFDLLHAAVVSSAIEIVPAVSIAAIDGRGTQIALTTIDGRHVGDFDLVVDAIKANSPLSTGMARHTALPYGAL